MCPERIPFLIKLATANARTYPTARTVEKHPRAPSEFVERAPSTSMSQRMAQRLDYVEYRLRNHRVLVISGSNRE